MYVLRELGSITMEVGLIEGIEEVMLVSIYTLIAGIVK